MQAIKSTWHWLSGKKRNIAHLYWSLFGALVFVDPQLATNKYVAAFGLFLTVLGYGHAELKKMIAGKAVDNAK